MGAVAINCTLFFIQYPKGFIDMPFFEPSAYSVICIYQMRLQLRPPKSHIIYDNKMSNGFIPIQPQLDFLGAVIIWQLRCFIKN